MAKKKTISKKDIIALYMDYVLEHNEKPKTIYAFSKKNNFEEQLFYNIFGSFEALEKEVFKLFFDNTIDALNKSEDYINFDSRNKLLSFYFTLFENLTANRSYVVYALKADNIILKGLPVLHEFKKGFTSYIESLGIETIDIKQEKINKIQNKAIKEAAWAQLLITIKFWMDDTSAAFEKTDIFIEKSVNTSFDILNIAPLKSVIDFGKFIFKEKVHMN